MKSCQLCIFGLYLLFFFFCILCQNFINIHFNTFYLPEISNVFVFKLFYKRLYCVRNSVKGSNRLSTVLPLTRYHFINKYFVLS